MSDIRTQPATDEYRSGWDRIFGKKGDTLPSTAPEPPYYVWLCSPCFKRRWPGGHEELTIGRISGTVKCHDCGDVVDSLHSAHAVYYADLTTKGQRETKRRIDDIPEEVLEFNDSMPSEVMSGEDIARLALAMGTSSLMSTHGQLPNSVCCLNEKVPRAHQKGDILIAKAALWVGAEILAMMASPSDGPHWDVKHILFGTLSLVGVATGSTVPLSQLTCITTQDLLSIFAGKRLTCNAIISVTLVCKTDGATFDGYRLLTHAP